ncbi:AraC family transcriptional regulator [Terrisporobacter sp.]|uniref:AraC family transcriptional regulator n=1 Tax=Terrisporobacter sp. TaxID=1965305 RepID=UPI002629C3A9|nr:AraC family transcriptional regulator [Terrisporobacter sp.]
MDKLKNSVGYLNDDFKIFHIRDKKDITFEYHHHDFNKIIIFIEGDVNYFIEGKSYKLKPWDILFVNNNEIHKPEVNPNVFYERIVIWINPNFTDNFINNFNNVTTNLLNCFQLASENKYNLLRLSQASTSNIKSFVFQIKDCENSGEFGSDVLKNALFLQLMVLINRLFLTSEKTNIDDITCDKNIEEVLKYINDNIDKDLSIDSIASKFFISKYYLMRKFKAQTGSSIHSYIIKKRLILSKNLIHEGYPMSEVSIKCGFNDYSSFVRAFKKVYGVSPKNYLNSTTIDTIFLEE